MRAGVESFALSMFYDVNAYDSSKDHSISSAVMHGLMSLEDYRALLGE
jgi:hypothetical protein